MTAPPPKPTIAEVLPLVNAYYAGPLHGAGGSLHVVLDDGNIDQGFMPGCLEWALKQDDCEGVVLCELLMVMSRTQRGKLGAAPHDGGSFADFWPLARPLIFDWLTR